MAKLLLELPVVLWLELGLRLRCLPLSLRQRPITYLIMITAAEPVDVATRRTASIAGVGCTNSVGSGMQVPGVHG
jgi:hypothetical protein